MATPNPTNSIATQIPARPGEAVDRIADQRAAERVADQDRQDAIARRPVIGRPRLGRARRSAPPPPPAPAGAARRARPAAHPGETSGPARARLPPCRPSLCGRAFEEAVRRGRGTCRRTNPPRRGSFRKRPGASQHAAAVQHRFALAAARGPLGWRHDPPCRPSAAGPSPGAFAHSPPTIHGNGRFDRLNVLIPPYAAGPYMEGDYDRLRACGPGAPHGPLPPGLRSGWPATRRALIYSFAMAAWSRAARGGR